MNAKTALEILNSNDMQFAVATDLDYYGPESTDADVDAYDSFVQDYPANHVGEDVATYSVYNYESHEPKDMRDLRQDVWEEFCKSTH